MKKKIILASASPRRKILLAKAGVVFDVVPSDYEEDMNISLPPRELAKYLSQGKAESVAERYPGAIIISADTFVVYEGKIIGKPHTPEKAKEILHMLSGVSHSVITGFTVMEAGGKRISCAEETKVFFKNLTDETINAYIATGEPLDKAGAYAAQELGGALVERIEGDIENVVGLPTKKVLAVLKEFGF
ncbi:MAG: Maf family protein [Candidatus Paceibacterota bacterium]